MAIDEGYIKYDSRWTPGPPPEAAVVAGIDRWRSQLFAAGLVGHYADLGVGYGNLSVRAAEPGQFIITGTRTGHLEATAPDDYALVTRTAIADNVVWSTGAVKASSEAMTHAALYALSPEIGAVVHVHSKLLWNRYLHVLPTTNAEVPYGTPAMAREFERLWEEGQFAAGGIAVMAGHEEGIVSIGTNLREAAERVLALTAPGQGR